MREGVRNLGGAWLERQLESPGWLPFLSGPLENLAFSFWQLVVFLSIEFSIIIPPFRVKFPVTARKEDTHANKADGRLTPWTDGACMGG